LDTLITSSPNSEALWAELHRQELLREAAASRRARQASSRDDAATKAVESSLVDRIRSVLGLVGRPAQRDCPECA
jgi:hypothetical protein